ncbi:MAG: hypothetical protein ACHQ4G_01240 [Opitutales bacterium]
MRSLRREQLVCLLALALFAGSAGWFGVATFRARSDAGADRVVLSDEAYTAEAAGKAVAPVVTWAAPSPPERGPAWTYELFTPPEIHYDAPTRSFRANGLAEETTEVAATSAFALEVLSVEPEPFRLQLIGYVGEPGHYLGAFGNLPTGELYMLRAGDRVQSLGLAVASLDVGWETTVIPDSMSVNERRATAMVTDTTTGKSTALRQGRRALGDRGCAWLALAGKPNSVRVVRAGEEIAADDVHFRVDEVRLAPPEVVVTKIEPGREAGERQTLAPRALAVPSIP